MFPELEPAQDERILCGLKIITVKSTLDGRIQEFECEDENKEIHTIKFIDGALMVDGGVLLKTVVKTYNEVFCANCRR
jgi:hypothetical protein